MLIVSVWIWRGHSGSKLSWIGSCHLTTASVHQWLGQFQENILNWSTSPPVSSSQSPLHIRSTTLPCTWKFKGHWGFGESGVSEVNLCTVGVGCPELGVWGQLGPQCLGDGKSDLCGADASSLLCHALLG